MKFNPIDPEGLSDRELLERAVHGINDVHTCVDDFRRTQEKVNAEAREKRHALANKVQGLVGEVRTVKTAVGEVKAQQDIDGGRITKLAKRLGAEQPEPGEKISRSIGGWSWRKAAVGGLGVISGAVVLYQILYPTLVAAAIALHHALMGAKP